MPQCPAKRVRGGEIAYCQLEAGHLGEHQLGPGIRAFNPAETFRARTAKRLRELADEIEKGDL